jgi:hypothetical protein
MGGASARLRVAIALVLLALFAPLAHAGINLVLAATAGGIPMTAAGNNYTSSFGTMNGLGVGTPSTGVTVIPLSTGALYYSTYQLSVTGGMPGTHHALVTAYVSTNFVHTAALIVESCPSTSGCTTSGSYAAMSTNAGAPTTVVASMAKGTPATAGIAIMVPDNDGAGAWTGTDTASITLRAYDIEGGNSLVDTVVVSLNAPNETLQSAVSLTLATATGGATIAPAADYSLNFGNVNGMGIGPGAGLTTVAVSGGVVYVTPYWLKPSFSGINAGTCTIKVAIGTNFAHPAVLQLDDASSSGGPFTQITAAPVTVTSTATDRSTVTRYLGLFVSNINGGSAFTGSDSATLTYTLTVP